VRGLALRAGEWLGAVAWLLGVRRRVALDGLRRAFPALSEAERRKIGHAAYRQLGRSFAEVLFPPPALELERAVRFEGWDLYEAALAQGHGVVCAVAHFGNFELLVRVAPGRGMKLSIIVRSLGDAFSRWLFQSRLRSGVRHLPDRGSSTDALAVLRRGEVLAIAIDQNMRPSRGIFVDFFGDKACTTPAAAVFALRAPRRRSVRSAAVFPTFSGASSFFSVRATEYQKSRCMAPFSLCAMGTAATEQ